MASKWDDPNYDEKLSDFGRKLFTWYWNLYEEALAAEKDSDYELNYPQFEKFLKVAHYLQKLVHKEDDEWVHMKIESPKVRQGYIEAKLVMIDIRPTGTEIEEGRKYDRSKEFAELLSYSSSYFICPSDDGEHIRLSMIIPDVYVKKPESHKQQEPEPPASKEPESHAKPITFADIERICNQAWDECEAEEAELAKAENAYNADQTSDDDWDEEAFAAWLVEGLDEEDTD